MGSDDQAKAIYRNGAVGTCDPRRWIFELASPRRVHMRHSYFQAYSVLASANSIWSMTHPELTHRLCSHWVLEVSPAAHIPPMRPHIVHEHL